MRTEHRCHVYGDHVNTDVIFPGKYTYTLREPEEIARHALEDLDPEFVARVQPGDVIVAGQNWGSGSSREQAVTALKWCGIQAIIAASFSGLYFRNCINQGLRPIVLPGLHERLRTGDTIQMDYEREEIHALGEIWRMPALSPSVRAILDAGGLVPMLQKRFGATEVRP